jgi:RNase P/RNase MRP subunit POP5
MDKKQAWDILSQATGLLKLTREEHTTVMTALQTLKPVEDKPVAE